MFTFHRVAGIASAAVFCAALSAPARAADLSQCAAIDQDMERLACYDRASGRPLPEAGAGAPAEPMVRPAPEPGGGGLALTPMQKAWDLGDAPSPNFEVRPHHAVYLLPVFATSSVNSSPATPTHQSVGFDGIRATEAKFQISFKTKVATQLFGDNGDLWLGYTQSSRWQMYSDDVSRPFRETNYEPEAIFTWKTKLNLAGIDLRYVGLGFNHQSNGRGSDLSRSWNRVIAQAGFEWGDWAATVRGWHRVREGGSDDDNPDITKYLGRGELELARKMGDHLLVAQARYPAIGSSDGKGSLRLDWAFPISRNLRGHLQWFSGYGESLIDYNHKANYIGLGVSLVEPF